MGFSGSKSVQNCVKLILLSKLQKRRTDVFHIKFSILECQKVNFDLLEVKKCSNRSEIILIKETVQKNDQCVSRQILYIRMPKSQF